MNTEDAKEGRPTLLSASQPSAASFFTQEQFDWSLHYNLLFHPTGLVSPDAFFFCPFVYEYFRAQPPSVRTWYEGALVEGLIIPFVRDLNVGGYHDLWNKMFRSGLQGHYDIGEDVANRLDHLGGLASPDHWKAWPDAMGIRFGKLVEDRFFSRVAEAMLPANLRSADAEKCVAFLKRTKPFRVDDVEIAKRSLLPEDGLRVSEILFASGRRILGQNIKVKNLEELLARMAALPNISPRDIEDARQFYKTLQELYNENLSNAFNATKNVTNFDLMSRMFSREGTRDLEADDAYIGRPIFLDFELPPVAALKKLPFDRFLMAARNSREFREYSDAFAQWANDSGDYQLAQDLAESLKAYVARVNLLHRERPIGGDPCRILVGPGPSTLRLARDMLKFGGALGVAYLAEQQIMENFGEFSLSFAAPVAALAAGFLAAKSINTVGDHWFHIAKIRTQKVSLVLRDDTSLEVHDQSRSNLSPTKMDSPDSSEERSSS